MLELPAHTPATVGARELEGPQEVVDLLEVRANSVDLVDQVLDANDAVLTEGLLNEGVVAESNALLVDLTEATLVDELTDRRQVGVTVGNPRLNDAQELGSGLVKTHEDTGVDLGETEKLEDLAGLGGNLVHTLDADDEHELLLSGDVDLVVGTSSALGVDLLALDVTVLLDVLLGTGENSVLLGSERGLALGNLLLLQLSNLAGILLLLQQGLRGEHGVGGSGHCSCVEERRGKGGFLKNVSMAGLAIGSVAPDLGKGGKF